MIPRIIQKWSSRGVEVYLTWMGMKWKIALVITPFWPHDLRPVLPRGVHFPTPPEPTQSDVGEVADLMRHPGWKVLTRFWDWQAQVLAHSCTQPNGDDNLSQGKFQGFQLARLLAIQVASYMSDTGPVTEEQENFYIHMAEMDRDAASDY